MAASSPSSPGAVSPEELLPALKEELGEEAINAKDYNLLKFLHWKPDVKRAASRYRGLQNWRSENSFAFDAPPLQASQDETLKRVLESEVIVAPEGMVDKKGRTVLVGRLRNNDMSDGRTPQDVVRLMMYTIDRALEDENAQKNGLVVFHDMTGLSPSNMHIAIPRMLLGALIGHLPIRPHGIYVYNAPGFFRTMFGVVRLMMPSKLRARMHFVDSMEDVYEVIDKDEMLEEHGGKRQHDTLAWVASQMEREVNGNMQSLADCGKP